MRLALVLEYDGSRYCGWQSQRNACSVQTNIEAALSRIAQEQIRIVTAGRTDAGVHARYQVVHFDTRARRPVTAWIRGTNALLPDDIAISWAGEVSERFHARYSALERRYVYLLLNRPVRPGIQHHRVGWFHAPLALERMQAAANHLIGEHDFSAFRAAECQAKTPVRTITHLDVRRDGGLFIFDLRANAFLHHMVRNIIGCLVYVGKGKYPVEWMQELLINRNRTYAAPTFSPAGLYLVQVTYDSCWGMPESAPFPNIADFVFIK
ncbi:MAG: tRNA pseudouridine(38-40) synthase TruA [Nitrosomonas sp.]|nr:MAG: tRNA pseudouridine(38-40) synthase TruA [Nitrosomonas sp.]